METPKELLRDPKELRDLCKELKIPTTIMKSVKGLKRLTKAINVYVEKVERMREAKKIKKKIEKKKKLIMTTLKDIIELNKQLKALSDNDSPNDSPTQTPPQNTPSDDSR